MAGGQSLTAEMLSWFKRLKDCFSIQQVVYFLPSKSSMILVKAQKIPDNTKLQQEL